MALFKSSRLLHWPHMIHGLPAETTIRCSRIAASRTFSILVKRPARTYFAPLKIQSGNLKTEAAVGANTVDLPRDSKSMVSGELKKLPFKVSRTVTGPTLLKDGQLTLFQYQSCPFCCKVRTFLDYYGVAYDVVEVNPVFRQQIKFSKYRKVPFLLVTKDGDSEYMQLNDSSFIISVLYAYLHLQHKKNVDLERVVNTYRESASADSPAERHKKYLLLKPTEEGAKDLTKANEQIWRFWADNVLVHSLSPNIYRTYGEAVNSFKHFSKIANWDRHFPALQRQFVIYFGALAMRVVSRKLKKKYGLPDDVRLPLYQQCETWLEQVETNPGPFHGGLRPNLADLAVFGLLSSIEGTKAFDDLTRNTDIGIWFQLMKLECTKMSGANDLKSI